MHDDDKVGEFSDDGGYGPLSTSIEMWESGRLPYWVYATCRLQGGGTSCSGTIFRADPDGTIYATSASHCWGKAAGRGATITYWALAPERENRVRATGSFQNADSPFENRAAIFYGSRPIQNRLIKSEAATGRYLGSAKDRDFGIFRFTGRAPAHVSDVYNGIDGRVSHRDSWTVGCPSGVWPPKIFRGRVTSSTGGIVRSTHSIASGHSGGSIYDRETGYLIGVTNWTYGSGGTGSEGPSTINAGIDSLLR